MIHLAAAILLGTLAAGEPRLELVSVVVSPDGVGFEIPAYEPTQHTLWVTRADRPRLSRFSLADPAAPVRSCDIDLSRFGSEVTSVAATRGMIAACVIAPVSTDPGTLVLLDTAGNVLASAPTGAHPDMVVFTPDGSRLLVANEGEPSRGIDPPGSVTVFDLSDPSLAAVAHITIGNPQADPRQTTWLTPLAGTHPSMVEPEYIACSPDGTRAFVTCQENNAIAVIDLAAWPPTLADQIDLGLTRHDEGAPIDIRRDASVNPQSEPVSSMPQPDSIAAYAGPNGVMLITADEGDPRDTWGADGVSTSHGFEHTSSTTDDGRPILFGSRGISVWTPQGARIATCSSPIESWFANQNTDDSLASADSPQDAQRRRLDKRAIKRGAEPEGVIALATDSGALAVVGFERAGAVGLFAIEDDAITLLDVLSIERHSDTPASPEGLAFVPSSDPTLPPLVVIADETGGTLTVVRIAGLSASVTPHAH